MQMHPVKSSNIASVGHEDGVLKVRFRDGGEYEYPGVTGADFAEMLEADSKGRWLNQFIAKRAGVTQTAKPVPHKKAPRPTCAETKADQSAFAGHVMRSQIKRTSRAATFRVAN